MSLSRSAGALRLARTIVSLLFFGAAVLLLFAFLLPAQLERTDRWFLTLAYGAFVVRTFIVYVGIGLLALSLIALVLKMKRTAAVGLCVGMVVWLTGWTAAEPDRDAAYRDQNLISESIPTLTLYSANVRFGRADVGEVLRQIKRTHPDIVLFQEYTPAFAARIRDRLRETHPHAVEEMRDHAFGEAVFSRLPFADDPVRYPQPEKLRRGHAGPLVSTADPQIRFVIEFDREEVVIQNTHLAPPTSVRGFGQNRLQSAWLAGWARDEPRPMIVVGDFNFTGMSRQASALRRAGLREAGGRTTWPDHGMKRHLPGFRIDRCYAKGVIPVLSEVESPIGSDHRAIVVRLRAE